MTLRFARHAFLAVIAIGLLSGCVGKLLGGGAPDALYRFGGSTDGAESPQPETVQQVPETAQQVIVLEPVRFAAEIDGNRMLAVSGTNARYIKGSRWVTSGPDLFAQALQRRFQARAPGLRLTTQRGGDATGYALVIRIGRFEAQYDTPLMASSPMIVMEGDATLVALADRKVSALRHFTARVPAAQNRVSALVAAFDQAAMCSADDIAGWVRRIAGHQPPKPALVCAPNP